MYYISLFIGEGYSDDVTAVEWYRQNDTVIHTNVGC